MNFEKLKETFLEHARNLENANDKTARFRALSYSRVADLIESKSSLNDQVTKDKIANLGLTPYMEKKVNDILEGKSLKLIKTKSKKAKSPIKTITRKNKKTISKKRSSSKSSSKSPSKSPSKIDKKKLIKELTSFMGIGEERAKQLVADGLTKINQLHMKKWLEKLPEETQLFLKLKPSSTIPHEDIVALEPYINKLQSDDMKITLVGSYRRGKSTSSDIDVMITSDNPDIIETFLTDLKNSLDQKAYPYSKGKDKLSIIIDVADILDKPAIYKLDAFRVSKENQIPMLLYSTGSKEFNIYMRGVARKKGYLLNQNGLYKKEEKKLIKIENLNTEKDYFDILDIPYKEPNNRV